jgi:hypothetical protein
VRRTNNLETKTHNQSKIDSFEEDHQVLSRSQQMQREAQNVHYTHCTHYNPNKDLETKMK